MRRLALLALIPGAAAAHGGNPQITRITFAAAGAPVAITDNQGLFAAGDGGYDWLCEDALVAGAAMLDVAVVGAPPRWFIGVGDGLFFSDDGGCTPHPVEGLLAGHVPSTLSPHPARADEIIVATRTFQRRNDVFRSTDGGRTWSAAGVDTPFQILQLIRSEADAERIYIAGPFGAARSNDGGRRFAPISLGPPELEPRAADFRLLGAAPDDADVLFAALEGFPDTTLLRSADGGASWDAVTTLDDFPLQLVIDRAGENALVYAPFAGVRRSADGGRTWGEAVDAPERRLGCLTRAPDSDRVWACTDIFAGGAWAVGFSDDFGRSFMPSLADFTAARRWDCPADARAHACCGALCPGLPPGGVCDDAEPELVEVCEGTPVEPAPPPADAGPDAAAPDAGSPDLGLPDAAPDAAVDGARPDVTGVDAGPEPDASAPLDSGPDAAPDGVVDAAPDAPRPDRGVDAAPDAAIPDARPDRRVRDARPPLEVGFEPTPVLESGDSGCQQGPRGGGWLLLLAGVQRRRRRRGKASSANASHQGALD